MKCFHHNIKMVKDSLTGLESCLRCSEVDSVMDELYDMVGEETFSVADVESYLRGPDKAGIKELLQKKEKCDNGQ